MFVISLLFVLNKEEMYGNEKHIVEVANLSYKKMSLLKPISGSIFFYCTKVATNAFLWVSALAVQSFCCLRNLSCQSCCSLYAFPKTQRIFLCSAAAATTPMAKFWFDGSAIATASSADCWKVLTVACLLPVLGVLLPPLLPGPPPSTSSRKLLLLAPPPRDSKKRLRC